MFFKGNGKKQNQRNILNQRKKLANQLLIEYYQNMAREQREQLDEKNEILKKIIQLSEGNRYDNSGVIVSKINELAITVMKS